MKPACIHCKTDQAELRPYGPNAAWLCFACMTATPEREAAAKAMFIAQLEAAGPVAVVGSEVGPYPAEHQPGLLAGRTQRTPAQGE